MTYTIEIDPTMLRLIVGVVMIWATVRIVEAYLDRGE